MPYKDKAKQNEFQRKRVKRRREAFFNGKICAKCGSIKNLVLHHKNPDNKESHKIWAWSDERINKEVAKCEVWCSSCHIKYHSNLLKKDNHGTHSKYNHGCRCSLCRDGHRVYQNNRNKKKRDKLKNTAR